MGASRAVVIASVLPGDALGAFSKRRVRCFAKVDAMGLFILIAVLGAAWLIFTA